MLATVFQLGRHHWPLTTCGLSKSGSSVVSPVKLKKRIFAATIAWLHGRESVVGLAGGDGGRRSKDFLATSSSSPSCHMLFTAAPFTFIVLLILLLIPLPIRCWPCYCCRGSDICSSISSAFDARKGIYGDGWISRRDPSRRRAVALWLYDGREKTTGSQVRSASNVR